ncbi:hypothetical protein KSP39_PZI021145 [Platanthera zijinensis]|uniref:Uncharacterized protein n=1 Tax=Platanthera zijinensis TaxID=2320716 RepID=A0AAP0FWK5_9ASPA
MTQPPLTSKGKMSLRIFLQRTSSPRPSPLRPSSFVTTYTSHSSTISTTTRPTPSSLAWSHRNVRRNFHCRSNNVGNLSSAISMSRISCRKLLYSSFSPYL